VAHVLALREALGVSDVLAQALVRRGMADPASAAAFLAADEEHPPSAFAGIDGAVALILRHVRDGSRIVVHGDYDVDGVCATAALVRSLRRLGSTPGWFLPSRLEDGYGLSLATVERLVREGTGLLVTVDCAITAVEEVAAARAAGVDVVVTDHHRPRADGGLPDAPIVHPALGGYPCPDLCAAAVAWKLGRALEDAAGLGPRAPGEDDLDLAALATVADCVPLRGENRAIVRRGMRALASTAKPGLRALMRVAQVEPGAMDAHAASFRLAPRINAAGRLRRADAGLELLLTEDEERADAIARELDAANHDRRDVETRILFEAERLVAEAGGRVAYVLAGENWHPGVIGIVASRLAERHHRPTVLVALDGDRGTGSGRSIPGFDLLAGLNAASEHLARHGGHRAAAGLEVSRAGLDAFRAAFEAHAASVLAPEDLVPVETVDAVVSGDALHLDLAEELERLAPFGMDNPSPALLLPAAQLADPVPMGEGKHVRFTVHGGGHRARAVAFGSPRLPVDPDTPADTTFNLERNHWNGATEARLVLRCARECKPGPIQILGEPESFMAGVLAELEGGAQRMSPVGRLSLPTPGERHVLDRRGAGLAGTIGALVHSGEPVLIVCADVPRRRRGLQARLGGFALCSWHALEHDPLIAQPFQHVLALDPPLCQDHETLLTQGTGYAHLAWGDPELRFAQQIIELEYGLRAPLAALYRALRDAGGAEGEELEGQLRGDADRPRSPALAGRMLTVLHELSLVSLDLDRLAVTVPAAQRTALERSEAFRAYERRREEAHTFLERATVRAA
jgi:single-stranded-DNA-specific exonuclease